VTTSGSGRTGCRGCGLSRLQSSLLQVDVSQIVAHEADDPNSFIHFLDADVLTSAHRGDVGLFAMGFRRTQNRRPVIVMRTMRTASCARPDACILVFM
jgi:hypothetical protein